MTIRIFYSWQTDIDSKLNRNFIEDALEKAVKKLGKDVEIQEALREETIEIDKDTKGVPGTPPIVETIFNKISACGIFLPDLTFVGKSEDGRLLPNPNVLIEYGWALKELSHSRIVAVMNTAFGEPTSVNMPFDMRHLRNPLTYHLQKNVEKEEQAKIRATLVNDLYVALELILKSGVLTQPKEEQKEFDGEPFASDPSTFLEEGKRLGVEEDGEKDLFVPDVQHLFLRLIPKRPLSSITSSKAALDLARSGRLSPMVGRASGWSYGRNRYGAYAYVEVDGKTTNLTQLFKSGELWGIDSVSIEKNLLMQYAKVNFGFFPSVAFEKTFVKTLNNYLKFAKETLRLPPPLKFIAGATNVLGYKMGTEKFAMGTFPGNVVEQNIIFQAIIDAYSIEPHTILRPFFNQVWEECGLERPDEDIL
jgi:hypothetical protein